MYLRCNRRFKDGKEHCYWNIVEAKRCADGRVVQRQVLWVRLFWNDASARHAASSMRWLAICERWLRSCSWAL